MVSPSCGGQRSGVIWKQLMFFSVLKFSILISIWDLREQVIRKHDTVILDFWMWIRGWFAWIALWDVWHFVLFPFVLNIYAQSFAPWGNGSHAFWTASNAHNKRWADKHNESTVSKYGKWVKPFNPRYKKLKGIVHPHPYDFPYSLEY